MSAEKCPFCEALLTPGVVGEHNCTLADRIVQRENEQELIHLKLKLASAEAKIDDMKADAESWQKQADDRLSDALEFGRRAEKAEARVKELEGLASKVVRAWKAFDLADGDWERTDSERELANSIGTLGDAMPRKDA